ncbi:DUF2378 family protein [Archangium violaceum]|uniref:Uncharacterized protein n=1 Tax=Archangium violaceum Cb vi76 TaxID=1406225 RepID=A0A084SPU7_9BACT|nr:DUF2378 family protein [Archangium violaceum]KFA90482.1 hypothetical protein Q664_28250 [Archangium violaceum Cb vi76]
MFKNERLVFDQTVEGLFVRAIGPKITPSLKQQLKQAGLDLDKKLLPAYPVEVWEQCLCLAARSLHPGKPEADAMRLLGERHIEGFSETMLGRALFGVLRLLNRKKRLARVRQNFRAGNNYQEVIITDVGPTEVDMWLNERGMLRHFKHGIVLGTGRCAGDLETTAVLRHFDDEGVTFRISWPEEKR